MPEFQLFRFGDGTARIVGCEMRNERGERTAQVPIHGLARLHVTCEFLQDQPQHVVGFYIKDRLNLHVIGINTHQERVPERPVRKGDVLTYVFEFNVELKPGYYSVSPSIAYNQLEHRWMDYVENMLIVHVHDPVPGSPGVRGLPAEHAPGHGARERRTAQHRSRRHGGGVSCLA